MPIRLRLALWYSGVLALVLVALGFAIYLVMSRHMDTVLRERVTARAEHLASFMTAANVLPHTPHSFALPPLELLEGPDTYVQVLDEGGAVLEGSSSLGDGVPPIPQKATDEARSGNMVFYSFRSGGQRYLARLSPVFTSGPGPAGFILVVMSDREEARTLATLRLVLLTGGGIGVLVAWLVGWSVAGGALRPIADMIDTARAIALSRGFSRRLSGGRRQDELAQLARAFNEMLASLEAAYATQQRFIADASHELRAPLTTIRANLDILKRAEALPPDERAAALEAARREAERMSRLVSDLLSLARADAGQPVRKEEAQLDAILLEVYDQVASAGPRVEVSLDDLEPVAVLGDADRLKQLLLVLVDNAVRYTPAGGSVTLALRSDGPWAVVSVADSGIGIEAKDLPHIFERFYRSEAARKADPSGTGLGLAIGQWIAEQHGGHITVESAPGKGSTFTVRLPAAS